MDQRLLNESTPTNLLLIFIQLRSLWYTNMILSEDEEIQRRGVLSLTFCESRSDMKTSVKIPPLLYSLPLRHRASHLCAKNPATIKLVHSALALLSNKRHRVRFRIHGGTFVRGGENIHGRTVRTASF